MNAQGHRTETDKNKAAAIVLAAGKGKRMGGGVSKQYLLLGGRPVLYYSLKAFEDSSVDEVILVTGAGDEAYCRTEIVEKYGFSKVAAITAGGAERYHSVYEGLKALERQGHSGGERIVLIHDGARPFADEKIIDAAIAGAARYGACVIGMPVKDTIKIADADGFARVTPKRADTWMIQTPQAFSYSLIRGAYDKLMSREDCQEGITDDAMVVESMTGHPVKLIEGSYENIKVTTPEDMEIAGAILQKRQEKMIKKN